MQFQSLGLDDVLQIGDVWLEVLAIDESRGRVRCGVTDRTADVPYREVVLLLSKDEADTSDEPAHSAVGAEAGSTPRF